MRRAAALLAMTALGACSLEPRFDRPPPQVPVSWPVGDAYLRQSEAALPSVDYRQIFRDPRLQGLIERALISNQDIALAAANIAQARAQYRVQRADLLPQVDVGAQATFSRGNGSSVVTGTNTGTGTITGTTGTTTTTGSGTTTGTGTTGTGAVGTGTTTGTTGSIVTTSGGGISDSYRLTAGLSSFEIDLFGRIRSLTKAAQQTYFATEAGARATRLSLVGELAGAWLTYAADRSLLDIATDTQASARRTVEITDARRIGGIAPRTDLAQAQTVLARAESDLASLTATVAQDRNAIDLLVGGQVSDADLPFSIESVDDSLAELPAGLDSEILLRRPDVVEAEYQLRAASARIGAARAAFFPRISLTAIAGLASGALSTLFSGGAFTYSVTPSATLPIFDGGANRGNLDYARASRDAAVANYQRTIQIAFREVADALARRGTIEAQVGGELRLTGAAQDALNLTDASYRAGITPFLNTLDAQRTLYSARQTLVQARLTRADNLVTLYRVIGGDQSIAEGADPAPAQPSLAPAAGTR